MILAPLFAAALTAPSPPSPVTIFTCSMGRKEVSIVQNGDRLTYTFGVRGRPELSLSGNPEGGVFYHREMYARGEDQTLRFVSGDWSYVVFNRWAAPNEYSDGRVDPEHDVSGLLVMKDGKLVRRLNCAKGSGDLHEWPIFERLKQDDDDLTPDDA